MTNQMPLTLINPQNGNLAFKIFSFDGNNHFDHIQRFNYYTLILVLEGEGKLKVDFSEYDFKSDNLICLSLYQPFMFKNLGNLKGFVVHFHPDFFCIYKHHKEVSCNGVLFNNIYEPPVLSLQPEATENFLKIIEQLTKEMQNAETGQYDLLVAYLKIFLITASRLKIKENPDTQKLFTDTEEPFVLQKLKDAIETHYTTKHSASDYAELLNISPKVLAKIAKTHYNKTLTDLIAERIVSEAKRELYLTDKPIKVIAYALGFNDEFYFSRFFKTNADVSPQLFRETVGFARAK